MKRIGEMLGFGTRGRARGDAPHHIRGQPRRDLPEEQDARARRDMPERPSTVQHRHTITKLKSEEKESGNIIRNTRQRYRRNSPYPAQFRSPAPTPTAQTDRPDTGSSRPDISSSKYSPTREVASHIGNQPEQQLQKDTTKTPVDNIVEQNLASSASLESSRQEREEPRITINPKDNYANISLESIGLAWSGNKYWIRNSDGSPDTSQRAVPLEEVVSRQKIQYAREHPRAPSQSPVPSKKSESPKSKSPKMSLKEHSIDLDEVINPYVGIDPTTDQPIKIDRQNLKWLRDDRGDRLLTELAGLEDDIRVSKKVSDFKKWGILPVPIKQPSIDPYTEEPITLEIEMKKLQKELDENRAEYFKQVNLRDEFNKNITNETPQEEVRLARREYNSEINYLNGENKTLQQSADTLQEKLDKKNKIIGSRRIAPLPLEFLARPAKELRGMNTIHKKRRGVKLTKDLMGKFDKTRARTARRLETPRELGEKYTESKGFGTTLYEYDIRVSHPEFKERKATRRDKRGLNTEEAHRQQARAMIHMATKTNQSIPWHIRRNTLTKSQRKFWDAHEGQLTLIDSRTKEEDVMRRMGWNPKPQPPPPKSPEPYFSSPEVKEDFYIRENEFALHEKHRQRLYETQMDRKTENALYNSITGEIEKHMKNYPLDEEVAEKTHIKSRLDYISGEINIFREFEAHGNRELSERILEKLDIDKREIFSQLNDLQSKKKTRIKKPYISSMSESGSTIYERGVYNEDTDTKLKSKLLDFKERALSLKKSGQKGIQALGKEHNDWAKGEFASVLGRSFIKHSQVNLIRQPKYNRLGDGIVRCITRLKELDNIAEDSTAREKIHQLKVQLEGLEKDYDRFNKVKGHPNPQQKRKDLVDSFNTLRKETNSHIGRLITFRGEKVIPTTYEDEYGDEKEYYAPKIVPWIKGGARGERDLVAIIDNNIDYLNAIINQHPNRTKMDMSENRLIDERPIYKTRNIKTMGITKKIHKMKSLREKWKIGQSDSLIREEYIAGKHHIIYGVFHNGVEAWIYPHTATQKDIAILADIFRKERGKLYYIGNKKELVMRIGSDTIDVEVRRKIAKYIGDNDKCVFWLEKIHTGGYLSSSQSTNKKYMNHFIAREYQKIHPIVSQNSTILKNPSPLIQEIKKIHYR